MSSSRRSNWNRESLGQASGQGRASSREKQLRQALGLQKIQKKEKADRRLGQILVDEGYLECEVLENFIQEQINDTLFDLFRWDEGELRFEADETCEDEDIGISVSVENIIMESARRLELWNRIRQKIPSLDTRFIMASAPGDKSMEIHLKPKEWMLLCYLHGGRTVRELVELTGYNDFETAKILYGMFAAGLIEKLGLGRRSRHSRAEGGHGRRRREPLKGPHAGGVRAIPRLHPQALRHLPRSSRSPTRCESR